MAQVSTPILEYAHPSRRRRVRVPGMIAVLAAVVLTAACFLLAVYDAMREPHYSWPADPLDVLLFWGAPFLMLSGWALWGVLTFRRTGPRWLAMLILCLGLPLAGWSLSVMYQANRSYRFDRARVAEWQQEAADEAAARTTAAKE